MSAGDSTAELGGHSVTPLSRDPLRHILNLDVRLAKVKDASEA